MHTTNNILFLSIQGFLSFSTGVIHSFFEELLSILCTALHFQRCCLCIAISAFNLCYSLPAIHNISTIFTITRFI